MFRRLLKKVFPARYDDKVIPDYEYFERTRDTGDDEEKIAQAKGPELVKGERGVVHHQIVNLCTSRENAFFSYLFGETDESIQSDPIGEFISKKIETLLNSPASLLKELPVMPGSVTTLMAQLKQDDFDINQLLVVIEREPAMAADVIKLANSALYKRNEKEITDLKSAFMVMGAKGMMDGVIQSYIRNFSPVSNVYFRHFGDKIWKHALQTATIATHLAQRSNQIQDDSTAYFVGLIVNLGKMIIFQLLLDAFSHVDPNATPGSLAFKNLIAKYHERLTFTIAKFWQLPDPIVLAIGMQIKMKTPGHRHAMAKHNFMALLIWEANYISEVMSLLKASRLTVEEAREQFLDNLVSDEAKEWVASIKEFKIQ